MKAIIYTDNQITLQGISDECQKQQWTPIFVKKENGDTTVVCFEDDSTARRFIKRNLPKGWLAGSVSLSDKEIQFIKDKGWKMETLNYPHKIEKSKIGFEVIDLYEQPDVICCYPNRS